MRVTSYRRAVRFAVAVVVASGAGCGGSQGEAIGTIESSASAPAVVDQEAGTLQSVSTSASATGATPTSTPSTSGTPSSGSVPGSSKTTAVVATTGPSSTQDPPVESLVGGSEEFFTSPSGNIACHLVINESTSCWIGEKDWEIERPADPFCEIADFGNAIELGPDGAFWPCYTDSRWDFEAEPLGYGSSLTVGEVTCRSERTGVTCTGPEGSGFLVSRGEGSVF